MKDFNQYIIGESKEKILVESIDENRAAALALAQQAKKSLHIFSHDLDAMVYDNSEFLEAAKNLAIAHKHSFIHIIIHDSRKIVQQSHRLVELSRRLSSSIHIRKTPTELKSHTEAFCIADETAILRRVLDNRYEGYVNFYDRLECKNILDFFKIAWEKSTPDPELRRLHF